MDPVTAAIVSAATLLGPEIVKEGVAAVVKDACDELKAVIRRTWGVDSPVAQSIDRIEKKPRSAGLAIDLSDEIAKLDATKVAKVQAALKVLTAALVRSEAAQPSAKVSATQMGIGNIETVKDGKFDFDMRGGRK